jgi:hypothetical protein
MKKTEFETFRNLGTYEVRNLKDDSPACFNEIVRVKKYKITAEEIPEPVDVVGARLQKLWDESDNYHDHGPLANAAEELGYELVGSRGNKRKGR